MKVTSKKTTLFALPVIGLLIVLCFFLHSLFFSNTSNDPIVHQIDGSLAYVSIPDLFKESTLIVEGTVSGHTDAFQIQSTSGAIANFTDYHFNISSIIHGNLDNHTHNIDIRTQGGTVGNYTEVYSGSPDFEVGKDYMVFLYQPGRGGGFNTEGDYYYVLGLCQGVFSENEDGQLISQSGEELTSDYLTDAVNNEPVDANYFRNEYIENQKRNLDNGFISQDEFDKLMDDMDKFATILD